MATKELPSTIFRTPVVRLSYPTLDKEQLARAQERVDRQRVTNPNIPDAKPGATLIFDARTRIDPTYKDRLTALVLAVANEAKSTWPKEEAEGPYLQNGAFHSPWHDGNLPKYKGNNGIEAGDWFIRPTSRRMILCGDRRGEQLTDVSVLYPGCYVLATVAVFHYIRPESHGVSFGLRSLQFFEDGPRLDDNIDAENAFVALDGDSPTGGNTLDALNALFVKG